MEWEQIDDSHERAKVVGGWLVKTYTNVFHDLGAYDRGMVSGWDWRVAMTFVPDLDYSWELKSNQ